MELELENWREWFEDLNKRFEEPLREGGRERDSSSSSSSSSTQQARYRFFLLFSFQILLPIDRFALSPSIYFQIFFREFAKIAKKNYNIRVHITLHFQNCKNKSLKSRLYGLIYQIFLSFN